MESWGIDSRSWIKKMNKSASDLKDKIKLKYWIWTKSDRNVDRKMLGLFPYFVYELPECCKK